MPTPILATKLYVPPPRPQVVLRPHLIGQLNEGLSAGRKLTLISAPAGFGKTTLVSEWVAVCERPVAWLSLDRGDNDPASFLAYFIAALQTIAANLGAGALAVLQAPQPPPIEAILVALLNEMTALPDSFVLVLDDYHVIDARPVDHAVTFLLEHLPPPMHLVIATREDPHLPLARLRARGQLTELRAADLRFAPAEAAEFLNQTMGLSLCEQDIAVLETRTEGWIAGLQLAAISMKGRHDTPGFVRSFTGSHHFVLDYLVEEVLQQQPESVQTFLLRTSILDRMCGPLCDAICSPGTTALHPSGTGQETLEYLERANLFIVPLDNERRWYRYHHLFAGFLRQRLNQSNASPTEDASQGVTAYHIRASAWYEDHGLELEAFQQAVSANDVVRAARLMDGKGTPLHFRGVVAPVLHWLESLPTTVMDSHPSLWVMYASALLLSGKNTDLEPKPLAAETALQNAVPDDRTQDLVGHIAAIRAILAIPQNHAEMVISLARRALELLHSDNLPVRSSATWALGYAYELQGDRAAARQAYTQVIAISQASGNIMFTLAAMTSLGNLHKAENQLFLAAETYGRVLKLFGDQPQPFYCEAYLGLAQILYEWNDLDAAGQHLQQSIQLARQVENTGLYASCGVFLARMRLAQGDAAGAAATLHEVDQSMRQHSMPSRMTAVAAAHVLTLLRQGNLAAAAHLAQTYALPMSQARVLLAQDDPSAAMEVLAPTRRQAEEKGWQDERLQVMVLQAVAQHAQGDRQKAVDLLGEALALAEPGGFVRTFVDEGPPMARLLSAAAAQGIMPDYVAKVLSAFEIGEQPVPACREPSAPKWEGQSPAQSLIEPLSQRELQVLALIAQGLSNREIGARLFLALDTVKGHNRRVYDKLEVRKRTEAVARARELGLL